MCEVHQGKRKIPRQARRYKFSACDSFPGELFPVRSPAAIHLEIPDRKTDTRIRHPGQGLQRKERVLRQELHQDSCQEQKRQQQTYRNIGKTAMLTITDNDILDLRIPPATCVEWIKTSFSLKRRSVLPPKISIHRPPRFGIPKAGVSCDIRLYPESAELHSSHPDSRRQGI